MAVTIAPVVTYSGVTPNRSTQTPSEFVAASNQFVAYVSDQIIQSLNVSIGQMNMATAEVSANTTKAENAANSAVGASNFKDKWSNLTGALNVPASVSHNGTVWILQNNLSNVASSEPSLTNDDWLTLDPTFQISNNVTLHFYRNR